MELLCCCLYTPSWHGQGQISLFALAQRIMKIFIILFLIVVLVSMKTENLESLRFHVFLLYIRTCHFELRSANTNVTLALIQDIPHGVNFDDVIQIIP